MSAQRSCHRLFARLVDRDMPAMRQRRAAVGDNQRVEFDEAVALLVIIADDLGTRGQFIADTGGSAQPGPQPVSTPAATSLRPLGYPWGSSSNTSSVLS